MLLIAGSSSDMSYNIQIGLQCKVAASSECSRQIAKIAILFSVNFHRR